MPLLRQARSCLVTHSKEAVRAKGAQAQQDAWSAAYLPLTRLLGHPLTCALRISLELKHDYEYIGAAFMPPAPGHFVNEHVVPVRCIIEALIENPRHWEGRDGLRNLKAFLLEHLILAKVPVGLNALLARSHMPNDVWANDIGGGFSAQQKQAALWGRYDAILTLALPHHGGVQDFERL